MLCVSNSPQGSAPSVQLWKLIYRMWSFTRAPSTWFEGVFFNYMEIVNQLNSFIESMICVITVDGK